MRVLFIVVLLGCGADLAQGRDRFRDALPDLKAYHEALQRSSVLSCDAAYALKTQPTSDAVGLDAWDTMRELDTLQLRIDYINGLHEQLCGDLGGNATRVRVARSMLWSGNLWALRRLILPMLTWDKQIGICRCFILYTGRNPKMVEALSKIPSIQLHFAFEPFASAEELASWRAWAQQDDAKNKVGGRFVMTLQHYANVRAIEQARKQGYQWLTHIDDDELLVPSSSLADELASVPPYIGGLLLNNQEGQAESVDVINRFEQVTLFRWHSNLGPRDAGDYGWRFRYGDWDGWWMTYHNGKSMVRIDGPHVHPWGPHNFLGPDHQDWFDPVHNPNSKYQQIMSNTTVVLHYTYVNWADVMKKASRGCPEKYRQAALTNNDTMLNDCFMLRFDLLAYKAAVRGGMREAQRFWVTNGLYSEGLFVNVGNGRCRVYPNTRWLKEQLIRASALRRVTAVREAMRAHELAVRQLARARRVAMLPLGAMPAGGGDTTAVEARRRV